MSDNVTEKEHYTLVNNYFIVKYIVIIVLTLFIQYIFGINYSSLTREVFINCFTNIAILIDTTFPFDFAH